jgi:microcystin-dependent protein
MDESYLGTIILFAGKFCPMGWMLCDGRLLGVAENMALFSILGDTYGGDGRNTFALPNLNDSDTASRKPKYIMCVNGIYPTRE